MSGKGLRCKGVIFDMDGVIFDSESVWRRAFSETNGRFGISLSEEYRQGCCGKGESEIRSELAEMDLGIDVDTYRDSLTASVDGYFRTAPVDVKPGFPELMALLKENGIRTALATSSPRSRAGILFSNNGMDIDGIFDASVFADDVEASKPDPEIFLKAAAKLSLDPSECIVAEDSLNGIRAAVAGGFIPVMVLDTVEPDGFVRSSGAVILNSLDELIDALVIE